MTTIKITGIKTRERRNQLILQALDCADKARAEELNAASEFERREAERRVLAWAHLATQLIKTTAQEKGVAACR